MIPNFNETFYSLKIFKSFSQYAIIFSYAFLIFRATCQIFFSSFKLFIRMEAKRKLIFELHKNGKRNCEILRDLKSIGVNKLFIYRTLKRYKNTGSIHPVKKPGKKRTTRTRTVIKVVRERIRRNPAQSVRSIGRSLGIPKSCIHEITKLDLKLKGYKKQKVHGLTTANKKARVERCKHLLAWHADSEIIFSDEKLFLLQDSHNQQNDRVYAAKLADAPRDKLAVERFQNVSRVMVWGAISLRGKLPLHFVDPGVKIDSKYYIEEVLKKQLLPNAEALFQDEYYCFQQDSAPAHKARITIAWMEENLPDFISPKEWPASSPDLNPLDFCVWGYMLSKLTNVKRLNLNEFKNYLVQIWDEMPMDVVRAACNNFKSRLGRVVKEKGDRIELR